MLVRSIDLPGGLCNGTRMMLTHLGRYIIKAIPQSGPLEDEEVLIPRIPLTPSDNTSPFRFMRRQYPCRVAGAMTINKSEGQTLKQVGLYLPDCVFCHGQLYVGYSRVGDPDYVSSYIVDNEHQGHFEGYEGVYTRNVVYKEVLKML